MSADFVTSKLSDSQLFKLNAIHPGTPFADQPVVDESVRNFVRVRHLSCEFLMQRVLAS